MEMGSCSPACRSDGKGRPIWLHLPSGARGARRGFLLTAQRRLPSLPMSTHHRSDGRFRNPWLARGSDSKGRSTRFGGFLRWVLIERPFKRLPSDPDPSVFPRAEPDVKYPHALPGELGVTWVGHSTALLQIGDLNVLTDPMWSARASPLSFAGPRRRVQPGIAFEQLPPVDVVLLSHNHYDHLDSRTVGALARHHPEARWFVPLRLGEFVRSRGVRQVEELDWWDEIRAGDLFVACTPAQHFSGRGPRDRNASLWCGWVLAAGESRVFFAGDTGHHPDFAAIGERYGPFNVALLPIGAYEPAWFMRPAHMNPEEAVRAFSDLNGDGNVSGGRMVPIHFGTFKLTDEAMDEPPQRIRRVWAAAELPSDRLWLLAHGETRWLVES